MYYKIQDNLLLHIHHNTFITKQNSWGFAPTTNGALMVEIWNLHCQGHLNVIPWMTSLKTFVSSLSESVQFQGNYGNLFLGFFDSTSTI